MVNQQYAIFTDLHLGVHQNSQTWHEIGLNWVDWFVKSLEEKNIKNIIFTGDFFHSRSEISVNTVHVASELLEKLKDFNILMIPGNHDCYYKDKSDIHSLSILRGYKNIKIFDNVNIVEIGNKKVVFCPWGFNVEEVVQCDVIFGHFEIESFKMNAHKLCEHGFKPKDLLEFAPLIFSGHFHMNEERNYDNGTIVYVGSPFQLDFGERDCKKGYYIIDFNDLKYNFIENNLSPVHKKITISEIVKDNINLNNNISNNFVRLVIDKKLDQSKLDNIIGNINRLTPISLTIDPLINYENDLSIPDQDLSGVDISQAIVEFINLLDIDNKEEVIKHTLNLYGQVK